MGPTAWITWDAGKLKPLHSNKMSVYWCLLLTLKVKIWFWSLNYVPDENQMKMIQINLFFSCQRSYHLFKELELYPFSISIQKSLYVSLSFQDPKKWQISFYFLIGTHTRFINIITTKMGLSHGCVFSEENTLCEIIPPNKVNMAAFFLTKLKLSIFQEWN